MSRPEECDKAGLGSVPGGGRGLGRILLSEPFIGGVASRGLHPANQLAAVPERLSRYPLAELRSGHRITYEVEANWKVLLENYNECYHCGRCHPELCQAGSSIQAGAVDPSLDWERGIPHREGAWTFTERARLERGALSPA